MDAYEDTQWDKDYRRAYTYALAQIGLAMHADAAGRLYADAVACLRGQRQLKEVDGCWEWVAGPFCSADSFTTQADTIAGFEEAIFELVEW